MHKGQIIELNVKDLAVGGRGIAKVDLEDKPNFTIFIDGALPGQTIEAKISRKKRRYAEAKLLKVITWSPEEVTTEYQSIPGAPWANLPVEKQHAHKQAQVTKLFQQFASFEISTVFDTYLPSPQPWHYRNKMEYSFGPTEESQNDTGEWKHTGFGLGSKKRGQFWLVENLEKDSGLFDTEFENQLHLIREWSESQNDAPYNSRTNAGFWRSLLVRKSFYEDKFLINMITSTGDLKDLPEQFVELCQELFGNRVKGIYWTQSDDLGNAATKYDTRELIYGENTLIEHINDLNFEISIDSFFQTNVKSAERLYAKAISYLAPEATQIFDLFCGTGTIGQIIASQRNDVAITGVEIVEAAVRDAQSNADKNGLKNIKFIAADLNKWLKANIPSQGAAVILDPPRAGISPKSLAKIIESQPAQIVYVSCNPATMARDTAILMEGGYHLKKLSLVDQFPHTSHVECVGSFVKT